MALIFAAKDRKKIQLLYRYLHPYFKLKKPTSTRSDYIDSVKKKKNVIMPDDADMWMFRERDYKPTKGQRSSIAKHCLAGLS